MVGNIKATKFIGASDTIFCSKSSSRPEGKEDCMDNCWNHCIPKCDDDYLPPQVCLDECEYECQSYCEDNFGPDNILTGGAGSYTLYFTAAECGGTLPNSDYIGTGVKFEICNGFNTWKVNQAPSPGVTIYSSNGPCGDYSFQVLYIRT